MYALQEKLLLSTTKFVFIQDNLIGNVKLVIDYPLTQVRS